MLAQLQAEFPQDVRLAFRHFPLQQHDKAFLAAQGAEAAGLQGKFWEMHDLIFETQATWADPNTGLTPEQFQDWMVDQAGELGLDVAKFESDLNSQAIIDKITQARDYGVQIQLPGTPFLLVNGKIWQGPMDLENLRNLVRVLKLQERQFTGCPEMTIDPNKQYTATIETEKGNIVMELYPDKAPLTVNSFVFLARQGWFDGIAFHRVVQDPDVAQTGDPSGTGWGGPGYAIKDEISDLKFDKPGVVGMANSGANTNGSQFFIARSPVDFLNGRYTVFAQVTEGLDVLSQLTPRDPTQPDQPEGTKILRVTIEEK